MQGYGGRMKSGATEMPDMDEFYDDEEYGDEDDYGSQGHPQYAYYEGDGHTDSHEAAMFGGIDGSGNSGDYGEEDFSDESALKRQLIQEQAAALRGQSAGGLGPAFGMGGIGKSNQGMLSGAGGLWGQQNAAPAMQKPASSGGFVYGGASQGGATNLFAGAGGGTFQSGIGGIGGGAGSKSTTTGGGGFSFGSVSQFGGVGGGSNPLFGAGAAGGFGGAAGAADDPYNIPIDLTKIKAKEKPAKTFEEKTSEEKTKMNEERKKQVDSTGSRSIMKKPGKSTSKNANVTFGQCLIYEFDKDPMANEMAQRVDSKDISDMRDEKTKLRDFLQEKENEQIRKIKEMRDYMNKKMDDKKPSPDKFKSSAAEAKAIEESIGESASLTASRGKDRQTESYETDTFEEQSNSQSMSKEGSSAKKGGINYWPGKSAVAVEADSASMSQSKDASEMEAKPQVYATNTMEEYMRRKREQMAGGATSATTAAPKPTVQDSPEKQSVEGTRRSGKTVSSKEFSESSDKYSEEGFESMSKSQSNIGPIQAAQPSTFGQPSRIVSTYVKKENKFCQTDQGKYDFMPEGGLKAKGKEWTLQRNLEDAEILIQEQKSQKAEHHHDRLELEQKLKRMEMELMAAKRHSLNSDETNIRLKDQLKEYSHKMNLYKIETEELIKQIDLADSKTREKEDELRLMEAEYDRKMKLQEERILFRRNKTENREMYELKRTHMVEVDELKAKVDEKDEEVDYLKTKIEKIEVENNQIRLGKGDNKKVRELENEVEFLKVQLEEAQKSGGQGMVQTSAAQSADLRNIKKQLTPNEQMQLQREIQQLDLMLKGYEEENLKLIKKQKDHELIVKELNMRLMTEQKQVKEFKLKQLKEKAGVFVENENEADDVDLMTKNVMGQNQAISAKELDELHKRVRDLQDINDNAKRDMQIQAGQFKIQISKLRDEKNEIEKQMFQLEILIGEKEREIEKIASDNAVQTKGNEETVKELKDKIKFFRENQKLLTEGEGDLKEQQKEILDLRMQVEKGKADKKRAAELERKCKLLEETVKSKSPNSIGMLLQANKTEAIRETESDSKRELNERISQLNYELEQKDREFEKKLRALRQEQERIKSHYENQSGETRKVKSLEEEIAKIKQYYTKRIREIEDKHRYGSKSQPASHRSSQSDRKVIEDQKFEISQLREDSSKLTKERNQLIHKVADLEQTMRQQPSVVHHPEPESNASMNQDIKQLFYQGGALPEEERQSPPKPPISPPTAADAKLNPFNLDPPQNKPETKSIPEMLAIFQKFNIRQVLGSEKEIKVAKLYNILTCELGITITVADLKELSRYLLSKQSTDENFEFLGKDEQSVDLHFLESLMPNKRAPKEDSKQAEIISRLQEELRLVKQQQHQDTDFVALKSQKMQREFLQLEDDKCVLQQRISKLEAQKSRLEQVFKATMKGDNQSIIDEVQMLIRRIEFLEEQSDKRSKTLYLENQEPLQREIEMLRSKLSHEREMRDQIVLKKNSEVQFFKAELEGLLKEVMNKAKAKKMAH